MAANKGRSMNTLTRHIGARAILSAGACMALAGGGATVASTSGGGVPAATAPGHAASVSAGSGAGSGGGSAASGASIPFPAAVGDTWVYKLSFALGSGSTATDKVVANVPVAGARQVTMGATSEGLTPRVGFVFHSEGSLTLPVGRGRGQTTGFRGDFLATPAGLSVPPTA